MANVNIGYDDDGDDDGDDDNDGDNCSSDYYGNTCTTGVSSGEKL